MVDAGWYRDPEFSTQLRWWDGQSWTEDRHPIAGVPQLTLAIAAAPVPTSPAPQQFAPLQQQVPVGGYPAQDPYTRPVEPERGGRAPRRGPRPGLFVIGAVVIIAALVLVLVLPKLTASTTPTASSSAPAGKPGHQVATFGTPGPPSGLTAMPLPKTAIVTAGSALTAGATQFPNTLLSNPACVVLSYSLPVTSGDKGSSDKILILPSYSSGGKSPSIVVSGYVRDFDSAAAAQTSLSQMTSVFTSCESSYTNHLGPVKVIGESAGFGDDTNEAWEEDPSPAGTRVNTVNFIRGASIMRVTCVAAKKTSSASEACLNWTSELQREFDR